MFTFRRKDVSRSNRFVWFEWWILRKQTVAQIAELSGSSERQLYRWFDEYMGKATLPDGIGTGFPGGFNYASSPIRCDTFNLNAYRLEVFDVLCYFLFPFVIRKSIKQCRLDSFIPIYHQAHLVGKPSPVNEKVNLLAPLYAPMWVVLQILRECLIWITKHPQSEAGIELRKIVCMISLIKTHNDRRQWISDFNVWTEKYKDYLDQKTFKEESHREWYTHKMVRRAYIHIKKALPDMFYYLDNPRIPKTTNALESFFGHLKENVSLHRGMSYRHYQNYLKWYLYFRNKDNKNKGK